MYYKEKHTNIQQTISIGNIEPTTATVNTSVET
jgi:hypothetical protein